MARPTERVGVGGCAAMADEANVLQATHLRVALQQLQETRELKQAVVDMGKTIADSVDKLVPPARLRAPPLPAPLHLPRPQMQALPALITLQQLLCHAHSP